MLPSLNRLQHDTRNVREVNASDLFRAVHLFHTPLHAPSIPLFCPVLMPCLTQNAKANPNGPGDCLAYL
jgi:hypothetical protein